MGRMKTRNASGFHQHLHTLNPFHWRSGKGPVTPWLHLHPDK